MIPFLICMYGTISFSSTLLMTIIIKYLKQKALQRQQVKDQVLADLAFLTGTTVGISSFISAIREISGPFKNVELVDALFTVYQFQYGLMLSCIVSLQVVQMLNVFFSSSINEWSEEKVILSHRLFVTFLGLSSSGILCFLKGGMCRPTALYYYILQGYQEPDEDQTLMHSIWLAIFVTVIITCQVAIETKRCLVRRAETRDQ